jgi:hypothetical protein
VLNIPHAAQYDFEVDLESRTAAATKCLYAAISQPSVPESRTHKRLFSTDCWSKISIICAGRNDLYHIDQNAATTGTTAYVGGIRSTPARTDLEYAPDWLSDLVGSPQDRLQVLSVARCAARIALRVRLCAV